MMMQQTDTLPATLEKSTIRLQQAATNLANAQSPTVRGAAAAGMAQESVFMEAMLAALHARIAESKEVTR